MFGLIVLDLRHRQERPTISELVDRPVHLRIETELAGAPGIIRAGEGRGAFALLTLEGEHDIGDGHGVRAGRYHQGDTDIGAGGVRDVLVMQFHGKGIAAGFEDEALLMDEIALQRVGAFRRAHEGLAEIHDVPVLLHHRQRLHFCLLEPAFVHGPERRIADHGDVHVHAVTAARCVETLGLHHGIKL